jgi:hypothetical protein
VTSALAFAFSSLALWNTNFGAKTLLPSRNESHHACHCNWSRQLPLAQPEPLPPELTCVKAFMVQVFLWKGTLTWPSPWWCSTGLPPYNTGRQPAQWDPYQCNCHQLSLLVPYEGGDNINPYSKDRLSFLMGTSPVLAAFFLAKANSLCFFSCFVSDL